MSPPAQPLHILHVAQTISHLAGGVYTFLTEFIRRHAEFDLRATLVGVADDAVDDDLAPYGACDIHTVRRLGPRSIGLSHRLRPVLDSLGPIDIVHCHGIRSFTEWGAGRFARRRALPFILSPHGQLEPWVLRQRTARKRLINALWLDRNLARVTCFHATAGLEALSIRAAGHDNPVSIVPIGIDPSVHQQGWGAEVIARHWPHLSHKNVLLFLSRVDSKKGLLNLAPAWGQVCRDHPDWHLVISGLDSGNHRGEVARAIEAAGATASTTFTGPVTDEQKFALLGTSRLFVLPTFSENFAIVITEALASGLPVITTTATPWHELRDHQCGWWIDVGVGPLIAALRAALATPEPELAQMAQRARALVEDRYAWDAVMRDMRSTYEWLAAGSPPASRPPCVLARGIRPLPALSAGIPMSS
ncbi:MAG: glycosyltransferase [Phycisphaerales bacterium]|nr:glycosyltransferase [Phycisphaerales bacterium]